MIYINLNKNIALISDRNKVYRFCTERSLLGLCTIGILKELLAVSVATSSIVNKVPVAVSPSCADWFFDSGPLGLVGISRREKVAE